MDPQENIDAIYTGDSGCETLLELSYTSAVTDIIFVRFALRIHWLSGARVYEEESSWEQIYAPSSARIHKTGLLGCCVYLNLSGTSVAQLRIQVALFHHTRCESPKQFWETRAHDALSFFWVEVEWTYHLNFSRIVEELPLCHSLDATRWRYTRFYDFRELGLEGLGARKMHIYWDWDGCGCTGRFDGYSTWFVLQTDVLIATCRMFLFLFIDDVFTSCVLFHKNVGREYCNLCSWSRWGTVTAMPVGKPASMPRSAFVCILFHKTSFPDLFLFPCEQKHSAWVIFHSGFNCWISLA